MLKWHGLTGNKVMTPNVIGEVPVLPKDTIFSGMRETTIAVIEWKVPSFAFAKREIQVGRADAAATRCVRALFRSTIPNSSRHWR